MRCVFTVLCLAALAYLVQCQSPKPLSIPPSEYWDGIDGQWSSFQIQVGTPPQIVRLLPGTSATAGDSIFVVHPQGCPNSTDQQCTNSRGYTFDANKSSTWSVERLANGGLFELTLYEEKYLGYEGNAFYGFDNITLGLPGSGMPSVSEQIIAAIATPDFWLGSLGLSPLPFNFTSQTNPLPSLLGSLRAENTIPSSSWAYTAGAIYQNPPLFGSLTLGGFDASRFVPGSEVSIPFGSDQSRDLVVGLQSIMTDTIGAAPLLSSGIYAFIDSMVPHLWLPVETCQAFEQAFNLTWNETSELYIVDDDLHTKLLDQNPTLTFTLGPSSKAGQNIAIRFPYAAFDLNISSPLVPATQHYFPLKRAQNSTQYTLGRVFLQEAYVIADYEQKNFSIAPALSISPPSPQQLISILPPVQKTPAHPDSPGSSHGSKKLGAGAIAGIVVGILVLLLVLFFGCCVQIRWPAARTELPAFSIHPRWEADSKEKAGMMELESPTSTTTNKSELPAFAGVYGLHIPNRSKIIEEAYSEPPASEMPS